MARLIVEVLDANGAVRSRTRLDAFPATIGRSPGSDVVLDDPYVDATHVRIVDDGAGGFVAEDAGSANGIRAAGAKDRESRIPARPNSDIRVGRTVIRFRDPDQAIAAALLDQPAADDTRELVARLVTRRVGRAIAVATPLLLAVSFYYESYDRTSGAKVLSVALGIAGLIALWAGAWALGGRLFGQAAHFGGQFIVSCAAIIALSIWSTLSAWVRFAFPAAPVLNFVIVVATSVLCAAALAAHLTLSSAMSERRRWTLASSIVAGSLGMILLVGYSAIDDFSTKLPYTSNLKPLAPRWVHAVSVEAFVRDADELRAEVDKTGSK